MKEAHGFTLIELVIVIAIIGILAVVAIPKFLNLKTTAQTNTIQAIAGALTSANNTNYAARKIDSSLGIAVTNCSNLANALQGGLAAGYAITAAAVAADTATSCTLTGPNASSTTFTATGIP